MDISTGTEERCSTSHRNVVFDSDTMDSATAFMQWHKEWGSDENAVYADGFYRLACIGAEAALQDRRDRDLIVFPIVFLYRHYVEVEMKNFLRRAMRVLQGKPQSEIDKSIRRLSHDLRKLWIECRPFHEELNLGQTLDVLDEFAEKINEFMRFDPSGASFRYADGPGDASDLVYLNIRQLAANMDSIHSFLSGEHAALMNREEWQQESANAEWSGAHPDRAI